MHSVVLAMEVAGGVNIALASGQRSGIFANWMLWGFGGWRVTHRSSRSPNRHVHPLFVPGLELWTATRSHLAHRNDGSRVLCPFWSALALRRWSLKTPSLGDTAVFRLQRRCIMWTTTPRLADVVVCLLIGRSVGPSAIEPLLWSPSRAVLLEKAATKPSSFMSLQPLENSCSPLSPTTIALVSGSAPTRAKLASLQVGFGNRAVALHGKSEPVRKLGVRGKRTGFRQKCSRHLHRPLQRAADESPSGIRAFPAAESGGCIQNCEGFGSVI